MTSRKCPNCRGASLRLRFTEQELRIVRCNTCALTFLENPPENESLYEDYYTTVPRSGKEYSALSPHPFLSEIHAINDQRLQILKKISGSGTLLDVGCGLGFFLKSATEQNYHGYGIDISAAALLFAQKEFGLACGRKSIDEILAERRTFDIITLWHVLEHFLNPAAELKKIRSLLNDDGVCIIEVPNLHSIEFMLSRKKWKGGNHPLYHRTFFTAPTLEDTLLQSGFAAAERLQLSYRIPTKPVSHFLAKKLFNIAAMDAFLDYAAFK
ncbi:MAG: class I SAM-dependent methyltransferase [Bacteroidota bacterium]|nr:class I SAM-dependent methyltransferase [Bacteroidota bacterium]